MKIVTADITTDGKRILALIPWFDGQGPYFAKRILGARPVYDKKVTPNKFKHWSYPLDMATCRDFRKVFGAGLTVRPPLVVWAREEVKREQALELFRNGDVSPNQLSRVRDEAPDLYKAMTDRNYQLAGAAFLAEGKKVILGDEPGLGKTLQTLAAIIESDARTILVACPRTATRAVWFNETRRWAPGICTFLAQGSRSERYDAIDGFKAFSDDWPDTPRMLIINTEMIRMIPEVCPYGNLKGCPTDETSDHKHDRKVADWPFLFEQEWDAIVLDESHNALATTKNVQSKGITQVRFGAVQLRKQLKPDGLAVALSGTPFRSKLPRSWGTLNWLRPDVFTSFWRFAERHFSVDSDGWGNVVGSEPIDQEAFNEALRPYYLVRTKAEAAPDLPPIMYAGTPPPDNPDGSCYIRLDMEPKQAKAYWEMVRLASARINNGTIMATGVLAELTRLRQFANAYGQLWADGSMLPSMPSNKIEWILDFLREREDTGAKVVIASSFTQIVQLVQQTIVWDKDISSDVLTLTGATSDRDRASLVSRFANDDRVRIAVINRKAGGEAITLDAADEMVIIDQPWLSDEDEQLTARIHRVSRIHQVTVYRLASTETVDEWMAGITEEQRRILLAAKTRDFKSQVLEAILR
jgi:SNF2 family DNA or RNA helicase